MLTSNNNKVDVQSFHSIEDIEDKYDISFSPEYDSIHDTVVAIFNNSYTNEMVDGSLLNVKGLYYRNVEKNYTLMKKYYVMAIEVGNVRAMYNPGMYYKDVEKKYLIMAMELGDTCAMNNLGWYYKIVEKDYDMMKECYVMAIEKNDAAAMYNFGLYYQSVEKNYDLMKKYYLMAIELGDADAMKNLKLAVSEMELYVLLSRCESRNDIITEELFFLKSTMFMWSSQYVTKVIVFV